MPAGISSSNARTNSLQAVWLSVTSSERRSGHRGPSSSRNFRPLPAVDHCGLYRIFVSRIPSPARRSRRSLQRPQKTISLPHGVPPYTHRASSTFPYQDRFLNQPTPLSRMIPTLCGHPQVCFQLPGGHLIHSTSGLLAQGKSPVSHVLRSATGDDRDALFMGFHDI